MSNLYWLTDVQMARLRLYFPKSHGKPRVDDQRVLSGIVFVNRNGLRWCDTPKDYGPAQDARQALGREGCFIAHDGGASGSGSRTENGYDRRDLREGTPHGIESAGKKGISAP